MRRRHLPSPLSPHTHRLLPLTSAPQPYTLGPSESTLGPCDSKRNLCSQLGASSLVFLHSWGGPRNQSFLESLEALAEPAGLAFGPLDVEAGTAVGFGPHRTFSADAPLLEFSLFFGIIGFFLASSEWTRT